MESKLTREKNIKQCGQWFFSGTFLVRMIVDTVQVMLIPTQGTAIWLDSTEGDMF
jgi:hypothetical protein